VEGLIRAYAQLSTALRQRYQLVIAGKISEGEKRKHLGIAKQHGLGKEDIVFTGYVSDEDLVRLYNLCEVFVFPSIHEGFGLPVLEAMACGAAVIGSNTTSIPEVIGRTDALFDPYDESFISQKLYQALTDKDFRQSLKKNGLKQAKKFSWDISALRAIRAFEVSPLKQTNIEIIPDLIELIADNLPDKVNDQDIVSIAKTIGRNHPMRTHKQLLIDISRIVESNERTGIQRVVIAILKYLLDNSPAGFFVEPIYATPSEKNYRYARRFTQDLLGCHEAIVDDEPIEYQAGDVFLGLDLYHHIVHLQKEFYQELRNCGVYVWFVVYDMLPILLPKAFPYGTDMMHEKWLNIIAQNHGAVCISKTVADELSAWLKRPQNSNTLKIAWFHLGADFKDSLATKGLPDDAEYVLSRLKSTTSFLMVGTIEPRKGYSQAIEAFEQLWADGLDVILTIVGKNGWMMDELVEKIRHHVELGNRLFWLEGISDEYLQRVYSVSTCLIAASEGEGFGLPLIEAAYYRLPIIARDIPIFREVASKHAFYFSGLAPDALAQAIKSWLNLYREGKHPKSDDMPRLTWSESVRQLISAIPELNQPANCKKILIIAPYPIQDPRHGGQLRVKNIVEKYRQLGNDVQVIGVLTGEYPMEDGFEPYPHIKSLYQFMPEAYKNMPHLMIEYAVGKLYSSDEKFFNQLSCKIKIKPDIIQIEQPWLFAFAYRYAKSRCPNAKIIYSSQNIEFQMKKSILSLYINADQVAKDVALIREVEEEAISKADAIICVSESDKEWIQTMTSKPVILAPNGVRSWHVTKVGLKKANKISLGHRFALYCASAHPPNIQGFFDMFGGGFDSLSPDQFLIVVGSVCSSIQHDPRFRKSPDLTERVKFAGIVDPSCLYGLLETAHCIILPITQGGGTNLKTAEALWAGKHIVATTIAMRGFERFMGATGVTVVDNPKDFKQALRKAMHQPPLILSETDREARRVVLWDECLKPLADFIVALINENKNE
jgi:glycosyltransferase involved in cell wall biosynthesis